MPKEKIYPRYYGAFKHLDKEGGYGFWLPKGWHRFEMNDGRRGVVYSPHADSIDTSFSAEKRELEYSVTEQDVPTLREGFTAGIMAMPEAEIESQDETITPTLIGLEARFTFLDGKARRKRWVRVIYWGRAQLILVAQGASQEAFDYWLPMFTNTMMSLDI